MSLFDGLPACSCPTEAINHDDECARGQAIGDRTAGMTPAERVAAVHADDAIAAIHADVAARWGDARSD